MSIIAETLRLIIREYRPEEEDLFLALHRDEQVLKYIPRRSDDENREIFNDSLQAYADKTGLARWGIFNKADGHFVGTCLLRKAKDDPEKTEMGYSMHVKYWGRGLGTEVAKAILNYGFAVKNFHEIVAVTHADNIASQNVLLKAGMRRESDVFWFGQMLPYFVIENPLRLILSAVVTYTAPN